MLHYLWWRINVFHFILPLTTTKGYGNIAPQTVNGRIFCIFFALIGIPFTLTVIADLGMLMASAVAALYHHVRARTSWTKSQAAQTFGRKFGKSLSVVLVVVLLIVYIAIGGGIFMIWEDWNFLGIYYVCQCVLYFLYNNNLAAWRWIKRADILLPSHPKRPSFYCLIDCYMANNTPSLLFFFVSLLSQNPFTFASSPWPPLALAILSQVRALYICFLFTKLVIANKGRKTMREAYTVHTAIYMPAMCTAVICHHVRLDTHTTTTFTHTLMAYWWEAAQRNYIPKLGYGVSYAQRAMMSHGVIIVCVFVALGLQTIYIYDSWPIYIYICIFPLSFYFSHFPPLLNATRTSSASFRLFASVALRLILDSLRSRQISIGSISVVHQWHLFMEFRRSTERRIFIS